MKSRTPLTVTLLLIGAAFAGCTGSEVPGANDSGADDSPLTLTFLGDAPVVQAGQMATLGVILSNADDATNVSLAIDGHDAVTAGDNVSAYAPADGEAGAFVSFNVAADAEAGTHDVTVTATTADGENLGEATTQVTIVDATDPAVQEARGAPQGEEAAMLVDYVLRLTDGQMITTSNETYNASTLPRLPEFQVAPEPLMIGPGQQGILANIWSHLEGAVEDETRTFELSAGEAFGEAVYTQEEPRRETLPRQETIPIQEQPEPYDAFAEHVASTGQGNAEDYEVNDTFLREAGANVLRMRIVEITEESVVSVFAPEVGDRFTVVPAWPDASEVTEVRDDAFDLYTTPTVEEGEAFTFRAEWPNASAVVDMDNETIVVEHTPEEGLEYETSAGYGQPPTSQRVASVEEDVIVVTEDNPHPFAGEAIVFDVVVEQVMDDAAAAQWQQQQAAKYGQPTQ